LCSLELSVLGLLLCRLCSASSAEDRAQLLDDWYALRARALSL
jgi:hypothetical protein